MLIGYELMLADSVLCILSKAHIQIMQVHGIIKFIVKYSYGTQLSIVGQIWNFQHHRQSTEKALYFLVL